MSDNQEQIESEEYRSEEENEENNKMGKKKIRTLGRRVYNKPKTKRIKPQSKNLYI